MLSGAKVIWQANPGQFARAPEIIQTRRLEAALTRCRVWSRSATERLDKLEEKGIFAKQTAPMPW